MYNRCSTFELIILDIGPRLIAHRGVGLPIVFTDRVQLPTLNVIQRCAPWERLVLVLEYDTFIPLPTPIVVIRCESLEVWLENGLFNPPIKPEYLRLVFID